MKRVLITGITGQDGSYLAELLLEKNYKVYGLIRRKSTCDLGNINHLNGKIQLIYGDMCDLPSLIHAIKTSMPDEIYNLAGQSFVGISWDEPIYTNDTNGVGVTSLLEAVRLIKPDAKVYQASTSELFGLVQEIPQKETTPFYPRSPYAVSKMYGHWIAKNYRESFNQFISCGILFNHESPRRGKEFVTRKITNGVARIHYGMQECITLGNLDSKRDWGHAKDYVKAMWLILQQEKPDDYIISTGEMHTVREFVEEAFQCIGVQINWEGQGVEEIGYDAKTRKVLVRCDAMFYRPCEVELLIGDSSKAKKELNWNREYNFKDLVLCMVENDLEEVKKEMI